MRKLNITQKILSVLFCFVFLICGLLFVNPTKVYAADAYVSIDDENSIIYYLYMSSAQTIGIDVNKSHNINALNNDGTSFHIPTGKHVILYNSTGTRNTITNIHDNSVLFYVENGATLEISGNICLNGNNKNSNGGEGSANIDVASGGHLIVGDGAVIMNSNQHGIYGNVNSTITINGGEFCYNMDGIGSHGTVNINGGKFYDNLDEEVTISTVGTLNINGGEFFTWKASSPRNGAIMVYNQDRSKNGYPIANINGGRIYNVNRGIYVQDTGCTINNGAVTFENIGECDVYLGDSINDGNNYVTIAGSTKPLRIQPVDYGRGRNLIRVNGVDRNSQYNVTTLIERDRYKKRLSPSASNMIVCWDQYYVTVNKGDDGIASVSGAGSCWGGENRTIDATVKAGYSWSDWRGVTTTKRYTATISGDCTFTAYSNINQYNATCYDYLTDGTYLGNAGTKRYNHGTTVYGNWWGTSSPYNNTQYTYHYSSCSSATINAGDVTVKRYWTRTTNQFKQVVNVRYQNSDGSWGSYSPVINKNYDYGSTVSWSRNEDACYKAASISYTATSEKTSNVDVYRKQYTVSLNKGTGINSVSGAGTYYYGQNCTISATPSVGYLFSGWTGSINDGRNPYSFSVSGNVTATANAKIETIDKTATINWNDKSNKNGSRPDSVTLSLYRDGEKIKDYTATGDNSIIAISDVWTHKITGLQRYNLSTGKEYNYTLTETVVSKHLDDEYAVTYSNNTWNITNKLWCPITPDNPEFGVKIIGTITWKDNNDQYHCRPDEVTLVIYQNGNYYDELTTSSDSYEFSGLPKYDANLDPYVYTVSESPIKNYTTSYNSYDTEITENNRTSKLHHCDITNTFKPEWTPDNPIRFGDNQLTITPAVFDKDGNVANADTYTQACIEAGKSNIYITLKQLNTVFVPVDAENGVYKETYGTDYSGIEYILAMTDTSSVNMTDILYGKYEISIDKINVLTLKELKALSSENAVFSYENGKYYVTFSYAYEHAKEYLEMDLVLSSHKGYQSSMSINNYFKVETEQQPILNAYGLLRSVSHNWESDYTIDIGPTCTENGAKSIHCSDCELVKDVQSIDALGHIDEDGDGICDRCGETLSDTTEVDATDNADNTLKNEFPEESTEQPEDDSATENIEENTETK